MEQTVASLISSPVHTVRADDTIEAVSEELRRSGLSFVPVVTSPGESLLGIISARDILQFKSAKRDPGSVRAWEICSYKPVEVDANATLGEVARLMVDRQEHHVIVMNHDAVAGVVSSLDFVNAFLKQQPERQA